MQEQDPCTSTELLLCVIGVLQRARNASWWEQNQKSYCTGLGAHQITEKPVPHYKIKPQSTLCQVTFRRCAKFCLLAWKIPLA